MIDFVKLRLSESDKNAICDRTDVKTFITREEQSGDIIYPIEIDYGAYKVHHFKTVSFLLVSLHKYWNLNNGKGDQNYDDFTYKDVINAVNLLSKDAVINPSKSEFVNLEYGLNLILSESPTEFIDSKVYSHLRKFRGIHEFYNGAGRSLSFKHAEYKIKLYDKGMQNGLDYFLLRYEVNTNKSRQTKSIGLITLSDLFVKKNMMKLGENLLERFDEILILDSYHQHASTLYWEDIAKSKSSATIWRHWQKFTTEVENQNLIQTKKVYSDMIACKWASLLG